MAFQKMGSSLNGGTVSFAVYTSAGTSSEHYGTFELPSTHKFSKIQIIRYINLGDQPDNWPKFVIGDVTYNRPSVGTEYNISNKYVLINVLAYVGDYGLYGVEVELS